jgi:hypothetical protein
MPAPGWSPHWLLGESESFFLESCDGRPCMAAHPRDDASLIRYEIDSPVGQDPVLLWCWLVTLGGEHSGQSNDAKN